MSDNKNAPCMFYMQGRIFIARRPAFDRMQAVFVTGYSATTDSELKRSGRELRIYIIDDCFIIFHICQKDFEMSNIVERIILM